MAEKLCSLRKKGGNTIEGSYTMKTTANNPQSITLPFVPRFFFGHIEVSGVYETIVYDADSGNAYGLWGTSSQGGYFSQISVSGNVINIWGVADALAGHELKYVVGK